MTAPRAASERIIEVVGRWPDVVVDTGEIGETAFKVGRREIGHLHGDAAAHFSFPRPLWHDLFDDERIEHHPVFPDKTGPAQRRITSDDDVDDVVALFRLNYDRIVARHRVPPAEEALAG